MARFDGLPGNEMSRTRDARLERTHDVARTDVVLVIAAMYNDARLAVVSDDGVVCGTISIG